MQIPCPHCGPRNVEEFEFRSIAPLEAAGAFERVYARADVPDRSVEHWQHALGCRGWLVVQRNPSTGVIDSVQLLGAAP